VEPSAGSADVLVGREACMVPTRTSALLRLSRPPIFKIKLPGSCLLKSGESAKKAEVR
jgi:hypothetical protein